MAKVWLCRDGDNPTTGGPLAVIPLAECEATLRVSRADYLSDPSAPPRFGKAGDPLATIRGYQHVVIEASAAEATAFGWRPGFYRAHISPEEAHKLLRVGQPYPSKSG